MQEQGQEDGNCSWVPSPLQQLFPAGLLSPESLTPTPPVWPPAGRDSGYCHSSGCRLASEAGESTDNNYVDSLAFKGERSHRSQGRESRPSKKGNFTLMAPFVTRFLIRRSPQWASFDTVSKRTIHA